MVSLVVSHDVIPGHVQIVSVLVEGLAQLLRPIHEIPDSNRLVCALESQWGHWKLSCRHHKPDPQLTSTHFTTKTDGLASSLITVHVSLWGTTNDKAPQVTTSGFLTQTSKPKMVLSRLSRSRKAVGHATWAKDSIGLSQEQVLSVFNGILKISKDQLLELSGPYY